MIVENCGKISRGTQTFCVKDNFVDGKMRDLNIYEKHHVEHENIITGLGKWLKKTRKIIEEKEIADDLISFEQKRSERLKGEFEGFLSERRKKENFKNLIHGILSPRKSKVNSPSVSKQNNEIIKIEELKKKVISRKNFFT